MSNWKTLRIELENHAAVVTLSRPELLNCFDADLHRDLVEALERLQRQGEARAVVLASTGKVFSAGGDLGYIGELHDDLTARHAAHERARELLFALIRFPIPLVVALHGDVYGLATTVVLTADAVVASRRAGLSDSHVVVGLVAGDGGALVWPVSVGWMRAKRHLLTGDRLGAEEAYTFGLVTDLVDRPEDAVTEALALARRIAALPPLAVQGTKRALHHAMLASIAAGMDVGLGHEDVTMTSDDLLEAIAAFRERRPGVYRGR